MTRLLPRGNSGLVQVSQVKSVQVKSCPSQVKSSQVRSKAHVKISQFSQGQVQSGSQVLVKSWSSQASQVLVKSRFTKCSTTSKVLKDPRSQRSMSPRVHRVIKVHRVKVLKSKRHIVISLRSKGTTRPEYTFLGS